MKEVIHKPKEILPNDLEMSRAVLEDIIRQSKERILNLQSGEGFNLFGIRFHMDYLCIPKLSYGQTDSGEPVDICMG